MSAALAPAGAFLGREYKDGWCQIVNPRYAAEVESSATPWLVPQRIWQLHTDLRIARCYDPRPDLECWCFRIMHYAEDTDSWEFTKADRRRVPFFDSLSDAKAAIESWEVRHEWVTR